MILGFHEFFDAKKTQPTNFREKILATVYKTWETGAKVSDDKERIIKFDIRNIQPPKLERYKEITPIPKLHTMRVDQFDRWRAGMSIQMVYRGPKYSIKDHFNKGIPALEKCISTQKVRIKYSRYAGNMKNCSVIIDGKLYWSGQVMQGTGGNSCSYEKRHLIEILAHNDGFNGSIKFFKYFNKNFTGKIIHFTDLRY